MGEKLSEDLQLVRGGHLHECHELYGENGHSRRCDGLQHLVECLSVFSLLLSDSFKLWLIVQGEENLVLGLVKAGKRLHQVGHVCREGD